MTQETGLRCIKCSGVILRVTEADTAPPWQSSTIYVCAACGEHHLVDEDAKKMALRSFPGGPVVDVSEDEMRAWASRGGSPGVCGKDFP